MVAALHDAHIRQQRRVVQRGGDLTDAAAHAGGELAVGDHRRHFEAARGVARADRRVEGERLAGQQDDAVQRAGGGFHVAGAVAAAGSIRGGVGAQHGVNAGERGGGDRRQLLAVGHVQRLRDGASGGERGQHLGLEPLHRSGEVEFRARPLRHDHHRARRVVPAGAGVHRRAIDRRAEGGQRRFRAGGVQGEDGVNLAAVLTQAPGVAQAGEGRALAAQRQRGVQRGVNIRGDAEVAQREVAPVGAGVHDETVVGARPLLGEALFRCRARQSTHGQIGDAHAVGDQVVLRQDQRAGADDHAEQDEQGKAEDEPDADAPGHPPARGRRNEDRVR